MKKTYVLLKPCMPHLAKFQAKMGIGSVSDDLHSDSLLIPESQLHANTATKVRDYWVITWDGCGAKALCTRDHCNNDVVEAPHISSSSSFFQLS